MYKPKSIGIMLLSICGRVFSTNRFFINNKIKHNIYNKIKPDFMKQTEGLIDVKLPEIIDISANRTVENPVIKHIVMAGGGAMGFAFYGALRESHQKGIWKQENIETIYATSIGTIMGTICLLYTSPSPRDRTRSRMPSSA